VLTEVRKRLFQEHYPQTIVWEYDVDKPFKLRSITAGVVEFTCLGIPYQVPLGVDGQPTIMKAIP